MYRCNGGINNVSGQQSYRKVVLLYSLTQANFLILPVKGAKTRHSHELYLPMIANLPYKP